MTTPRDIVLPDDYHAFLGQLKDRVRRARVQALRQVNSELPRAVLVDR